MLELEHTLDTALSLGPSGGGGLRRRGGGERFGVVRGEAAMLAAFQFVVIFQSSNPQSPTNRKMVNGLPIRIWMRSMKLRVFIFIYVKT